MGGWTEDDPGAADLGRISTLAADLASVADAASHAQSRLVSLHDQLAGVDWSGTTANAFRDRIGKLPGHLGQLASSYTDAAQGFTAYVATVTDIQFQVTAAKSQLADAQAAAQRATAAQRSYQPPTDPSTGQPVPNSKNPHDEEVSQAQAEITKAQHKLKDLADQRRTADSNAAGKLHDAHDAGMHNASGWSHFWSSVGNDLSSFGDSVWHGIEGAGQFVGAMAEYYWQHPDVLAHQILDDLAMVGGVMMMVGAVGGEAGGVILDATGVGAIAGVPINVASAGLFMAGLGVTAGGFMDGMNTTQEAIQGTEEQLAEDAEADVIDTQGGSSGAWNKELNKPKPNSTYRVNDNFEFKTDSEGRTTEANATLSDDTPPGPRNEYQQRTAGGKDRLPGDEGGHIFGSQFGGPGEGINLTAMKSSLNSTGQRLYYQLEQRWARMIGEGKSVDVNVKIEYDGGRPTEYVVSYKVDGGPVETQFFDNAP